jgi:N-acetylmuramic acid 6-phosphate (MurNAc-6-P) etherase
VKVAVVMLRLRLPPQEAEARLLAAQGSVRRALGEGGSEDPGSNGMA